VKNLDIVPISNRADHWYLQRAELKMQRYNTPVPTSIRLLK
jgi:peptide/nickel transport system substrate-binding protein